MNRETPREIGPMSPEFDREQAIKLGKIWWEKLNTQELNLWAENAMETIINLSEYWHYDLDEIEPGITPEKIVEKTKEHVLRFEKGQINYLLGELKRDEPGFYVATEDTIPETAEREVQKGLLDLNDIQAGLTIQQLKDSAKEIKLRKAKHTYDLVKNHNNVAWSKELVVGVEEGLITLDDLEPGLTMEQLKESIREATVNRMRPYLNFLKKGKLSEEASNSFVADILFFTKENGVPLDKLEPGLTEETLRKMATTK